MSSPLPTLLCIYLRRLHLLAINSGTNYVYFIVKPLAKSLIDVADLQLSPEESDGDDDDIFRPVQKVLPETSAASTGADGSDEEMGDQSQDDDDGYEDLEEKSTSSEEEYDPSESSESEGSDNGEPLADDDDDDETADLAMDLDDDEVPDLLRMSQEEREAFDQDEFLAKQMLKIDPDFVYDEDDLESEKILNRAIDLLHHRRQGQDKVSRAITTHINSDALSDEAKAEAMSEKDICMRKEGVNHLAQKKEAMKRLSIKRGFKDQVVDPTRKKSKRYAILPGQVQDLTVNSEY